MLIPSNNFILVMFSTDFYDKGRCENDGNNLLTFFHSHCFQQPSFNSVLKIHDGLWIGLTLFYLDLPGWSNNCWLSTNTFCPMGNDFT